ncbi:MAG: Mg/Co/Ni transporter MgtE / domain protein [Myxococcales bacterium]|nr:Mg/Co/Ni transporter MgtE / domain protein [Myxococcales bacterium]
MAPPPDDSIPEPVADRPENATGEISMLPPEEASKIAAEIKAIAETRGEDSEVVELVEPQASGRSRRSTILPPMPTTIGATPPEPPPSDDELSADELRDAWPLLDLEERSDGLRVLPREDAEDFFVSLSAADQAALLLHFRPGQRRQWMRLLEPDDVADVIQEVDDPDQKKTLLALLDAPTRKEVTALLAYAEDEAGGLMSTRYARLRPQMTADEAVSFLRRQAQAKLETIYVAYVLDPEQRLLGVVSFRELFAAEPKRTVAELMETDVIRVTDEMDQEAVSRVFAEHDLNVVPVVDSEGRMKGIVTVDDIVDVVQEEATEDAQKFGGMDALEMPYLQSSRMDMIKKRGRWLILLLVGSMLTTTAMESFEGQIARVPVLSVFIAMIVSTGGNSGSQASTLVIRAMALGEVRAADWWLILRRELFIGFALGIVLFAVAFIRVAIWGSFGRYGDHYMLIALAVSISVIGCTTAGTFAGAMLPFVLRRLGADPASASAPFVATLVDVSGILIYFGIANLILGRVLPL